MSSRPSLSQSITFREQADAVLSIQPDPDNSLALQAAGETLNRLAEAEEILGSDDVETLVSFALTVAYQRKRGIAR